LELQVETWAKDGLYNSPAEKEIMAEILSCSDRIAFKMRQEAHYYKHNMVKIVYLATNEEKYRINLMFDQNVNEKMKKQFAKGIWQELKK